MICYASSAGFQNLSAVDSNGVIRGAQQQPVRASNAQPTTNAWVKFPPIPAFSRTAAIPLEARRFVRVLAAILLVVVCGVPVALRAQTPAPASTSPIIPQQVRFTGKLAARSSESVEAVFRIYAAPEGGAPLWTETQQVSVAADGSYSVLLGSATTSGLPQAVFSGGEARWLGVTVERGEEQERVLLPSVPYAMKSADAESLAGHAAAEFATQDQLTGLATRADAVARATAAISAQPDATAPTGTGVANTVPLWTGSSTLGNSIVTQSNGKIGINYAAPTTTLEVGGPMTVHGTLTFPPGQPATSTNSSQSQSFSFSSSAWNSSTAAPVSSTYTWLAGPTGNNTATPNSILYLTYQNGSSAAINMFTMNGKGVMQLPNSTGGILSNGNVSLAPASVATSAAATNSPLLEIGASSFSSASNVAHAQTFAWQALGAANDTASPTGSLALLYGSNGATPAATGLAIAPNGQITFAPGQQFPTTGSGAISGITTSSPLTGSGTSGSVALGLNETQLTTDITPALRTTFNSIYPLLNGANTLTGNQTIDGMLTETVGASGSLGPILALTNPSGGSGAAASIDFRTYLHTNSAATPTARIVAVDDNNYGNSLIFASKLDGADSNPVVENMVIASVGGVYVYGSTINGAASLGLSAYGGLATGSNYGGEAIEAYGGNGGAGAGDGIRATAGDSATGEGGTGGVFAGGSAKQSGQAGGYGGIFEGGQSTTGNAEAGVYAQGENGDGTVGYAALLDGNVNVYGTLYAAGTDFEIEHPVDPANKYLMHASVGSSEQMNLYTGNVVTDQYGNATVKLPAWFQALNADFRYQLTVIGRFAQAIVSKEIENNQFTISTNATFVKVSWQVTAVRHDAYAEAHPLVVEQDKPANERGYYLRPEIYGQPKEKQTEWGRHPETMKRLQTQRQHGNLPRPAALPAYASASR